MGGTLSLQMTRGGIKNPSWFKYHQYNKPQKIIMLQSLGIEKCDMYLQSYNDIQWMKFEDLVAVQETQSSTTKSAKAKLIQNVIFAVEYNIHRLLQ